MNAVALTGTFSQFVKKTLFNESVINQFSLMAGKRMKNVGKWKWISD